MPASGAIRVKGLNELHRALKSADKETRLGVRKVEREVAEPVRVEAEQLAAREITNIRREKTKIDWTPMRIGITTKVVYVAPKTKRTIGSPRRKFGTKLVTEAMEPALERNRHKLEAGLENMLEHMSENFNRG